LSRKRHESDGPFDFDRSQIEAVEFVPVALVNQMIGDGSRTFTPTFLKVLSFSARWPYKAAWPTRLRLRGFSTILTVATGLLKIDNAPAVYLTNALFFVGAERPMLDQNRSARATNITGDK